jgi:superoxide dismutase
VQRINLEDASLEEIVRSSVAGSNLFNAAAHAWNHAFLWHIYQQRRLDYIAAFLAHLVDWTSPTQSASGPWTGAAEHHRL